MDNVNVLVVLVRMHADGSAGLERHPADFLDGEAVGIVVPGEAVFAVERTFATSGLFSVPGFEAVLGIDLLGHGGAGEEQGGEGEKKHFLHNYTLL